MKYSLQQNCNITFCSCDMGAMQSSTHKKRWYEIKSDGSLRGIHSYDGNVAKDKHNKVLDVNHDKLVMMQVKSYKRKGKKDVKGVAYLEHHPDAAVLEKCRPFYIVEYLGEPINSSICIADVSRKEVTIYCNLRPKGNES